MSYTRRWRGILFLMLAAILAGCATPQVSSLQKHAPPDLALRATIAEVPFFPQEEYQCGPAALAMVASAAGVPLLPDQLVDQVYLPARKGSLQQEMLATGRRHGLLTYQINPDLESLFREIAAGNPVVVLQNLGVSALPKWHYAVAIGFDRARNVVILHSGLSERLEMSMFTFERTWARSGFWGMLALPPSRLPATANADRYLAAAAALERVNPGSAQLAYRAALRSWPEHRTAWLGLGNTSYALGQHEAARSAYEQLISLHADFADAWNNLAQVLLDQGQLNSASQAIRKAIALGGSRLPLYQQLQREIDVRMGAVQQSGS